MGNKIRADLVVCTVRMYLNLMFVGFDRSRWIQELDELDRIINENLEQILEQRRILASLDVGREADLIGEFLEELSRRAKCISQIASGCLRDHAANVCGTMQLRRRDYISVILCVRLGLNEAILFRASYGHRH